ncbi:lipid A deacylase LpxR family protein [Stigmatella sp. ncwal1]|uniref:Lipid A deacylase LpxR family protein n=1 Tax=Stigmatella ashevillensis TaxID=2995309 RepID=A0ABT5D5H6_9BACT|nr:lipid A deacylase LpxR family protein [Stigmatella ashevillena]MDC0707492.1 lipid A deacylase LpxR family protein [Stigmatella ashevillena]
MRLLLLVAMVWVQAPAEASLGALTLQTDNDLYVSSRDRHYTSGLQLAWTSAADAAPGWMVRLARLSGNEVDSRVHWMLALGQNIYTPAGVGLRVRRYRDRPYGGWLYGSWGLIRASPEGFDAATLHLGMVGEASLAKPSQELLHRVLGMKPPLGWEKQLRNEPGMALLLTRQLRLVRPPAEDRAGFELTAHGNACLGNVFTYAGAGLGIRWGKGLARDFGHARISPGLPGASTFERREGWAWSLFVGSEARLVARNLFLDGNTFTDSASVPRRVLVADVEAGASLTYQNVRLTYAYVVRSEEFTGQKGVDVFGSISLAFIP